MPMPIEFQNPNTIFKKALQAVDDYCSWGGKKVQVMNDENDVIIQNRSSSLWKTFLKVVSYATVIIPLVMYGLQTILHKYFKAEVISIHSPNLNERQKEVLYSVSRNKDVWENDFGFSKEALLNHPAAVDFLRKSGLLYTIKAYQSSNYEALKVGIKFDIINGQPLILVNGEQVGVNDLLDPHTGYGMTYNKETQQIMDRYGREWGYYPPTGLSVAPWTFSQSQEIYKLNEAEMETLRATAGKFDANIPVTPETEFIQIFTSEDIQDKPPTGLTKNFGNLGFSHTGVRLIKADGTVYSFAIENKYFETTLKQGFPFSFVSTVPANISRRDYQEIRPFGHRYITTIPIAEGQAKVSDVLDELQAISKVNDVRFNFAKMNCVAFADLVLGRFGVNKPECEMQLGELLSTAMPGFDGNYDRPPYVRNQFQIFMENVLSKTLGMEKVHPDVDNSKDHSTLNNYWHKMWDMGRPDSIGGLTSESRARFMWSGSLNRWQKTLGSTVEFNYNPKNPRLMIVETHNNQPAPLWQR